MASAFTHAFASYTIGKLMPGYRIGWKTILLGMFCAAMPDLDVLAFKFGIPYDHLFGHRGITHSIFFSAITAFVVKALFYPNTKMSSHTGVFLLCFFFLSTVSHAILDAMTTGGMGVAIFAPFDESRHFLPWRFIKVSPLSISQFFGEWGKRVLISEFTYVWIPSIIALLLTMPFRRSKK